MLCYDDIKLVSDSENQIIRHILHRLHKEGFRADKHIVTIGGGEVKSPNHIEVIYGGLLVGSYLRLSKGMEYDVKDNIGQVIPLVYHGNFIVTNPETLGSGFKGMPAFSLISDSAVREVKSRMFKFENVRHAMLDYLQNEVGYISTKELLRMFSPMGRLLDCEIYVDSICDTIMSMGYYLYVDTDGTDLCDCPEFLGSDMMARKLMSYAKSNN